MLLNKISDEVIAAEHKSLNMLVDFGSMAFIISDDTHILNIRINTALEIINHITKENKIEVTPDYFESWVITYKGVTIKCSKLEKRINRRITAYGRQSTLRLKLYSLLHFLCSSL